MTLLSATTSGTGIVYPSRAHRHEVTAGILGVRVIQSLVFCVVFCRMVFVPLSFFFWLLHCLSFTEIRLLITH